MNIVYNNCNHLTAIIQVNLYKVAPPVMKWIVLVEQSCSVHALKDRIWRKEKTSEFSTGLDSLYIICDNAIN